MTTNTVGELRGHLEAASADQAEVLVSRSIEGADDLIGFMVGLGEAWVLLSILSSHIYLNGYAAVRLSDVSEVTRRGGPDSSSVAP